MTWSEVFDRARRSLHYISEWLNNSLLTININKTKYLKFGPNSESTAQENLYIHQHSTDEACSCLPLESVTHHKYLGIVIDNKMNWKKQIEYLHSRLKKFIYIFYNLKVIIPEEITKLIYIGMFQSALQHGIVVWGGTYATNLTKLFNLQKAVLKIRLSKPRRLPSKDAFDLSKVFTVRQLFIKNLLLYFYKNPNLITDVSLHDYPTRYKMEGNVINPKPHSVLMTNSPKYILYVIHRALPQNLKLPETFTRSNYKKEIFTWLIKLGYERAETIIKSVYVA